MAPDEADKPLCFAIMPITTPDDAVDKYGGDREHFVHVAEFIFKPAAERAGYRFVPAAVDSSKVIQAAIIKNLAEADVVLCDTSLWNANVFFELGIRVALNKPVAMVKDRLTEAVPFDNTPVHCHEYDHRMDPWCLQAEIPKLAGHISAAGKHEQNELWKFAGIQVTAQQSEAGSPEDAQFKLLMSEFDQLRREVRAIKETDEPPARFSDPAAFTRNLRRFIGTPDESNATDDPYKIVIINQGSEAGDLFSSKFVPYDDGKRVGYILKGPLRPAVRDHLIEKTRIAYPKAKELRILSIGEDNAVDVIDTIDLRPKKGE